MLTQRSSPQPGQQRRLPPRRGGWRRGLRTRWPVIQAEEEASPVSATTGRARRTPRCVRSAGHAHTDLPELARTGNPEESKSQEQKRNAVRQRGRGEAGQRTHAFAVRPTRPGHGMHSRVTAGGDSATWPLLPGRPGGESSARTHTGHH